MNSDNTPPVPSQTLPPIPNAESEPPLRLFRLLGGLALVVATFDLCFWDAHHFGFCVAVFGLILTGALMANRASGAQKRTTRFMLLLAIGAALAAAVETGATNTLVWISLTIALAGDTFFRGVGEPWGRWLSQIVALAGAPGRLFWLGCTLVQAGPKKGFAGIRSLAGIVFLTLPALVLALIFGTLLTSGNAVFGSWAHTFFDSFWKFLEIYLNFDRIILWGVVAFIALPLLWPGRVAEWWWRWTHRLPRFPEIMPIPAAQLGSSLILVVLNVMFFVANLADLLFLWSGQALPQGVNYSQFVHQGVEFLIATVLLSALVLAALFQQALGVTQRRELKALALAWIAQNLFLILSVALRLKLYIEAYDMTVLRLGVIIFLVVVAAGFVLLTIKIIWDRSLSWLIGGCVLAVFTTFYIVQFLDLAGWSARYNVAQWERNRARMLDVNYLSELGPPAWPALRHALNVEPTDLRLVTAWNTACRGETSAYETGLKWRYWREFSLRAWMNRPALE